MTKRAFATTAIVVALLVAIAVGATWYVTAGGSSRHGVVSATAEPCGSGHDCDSYYEDLAHWKCEHSHAATVEVHDVATYWNGYDDVPAGDRVYRFSCE
jgi:hypothetical protein